MATLESSLFDITRLDELAGGDTPIHRLDPRIKVLTTLAFVGVVMSFGKYTIAQLVPFFIYPIVVLAVGGLPTTYLFRKVLIALPFALFVGLFNPLFDHEIRARLGPIVVSGGWISFASILIRFVLTVGAALVLIACTGFNTVCMAVGRMGAPRSFVVQLLFLYRYLFVLADEALRMVRARTVRTFGGKGMGVRVFSSMIGQLLLRTLDRAQRIHLAMLSRGFDGRIPMRRPLKLRAMDLGFLFGWVGLFAVMRWIDIPSWLGETITELMH